jgi:hypothetical protein
MREAMTEKAGAGPDRHEAWSGHLRKGTASFSRTSTRDAAEDAPADDDVVDAEFSEVEDDKKD